LKEKIYVWNRNLFVALVESTKKKTQQKKNKPRLCGMTDSK